MAIGIQNTDNVDAPDSDYPYGKVRDNDGTGNGTPANTKTLGDFHQYFARLLDIAGISPNGLPDNDYSGFQYFEALLKVISDHISIPRGTDLDNEIFPGLYLIADTYTNIPVGMGATANMFVTTVGSDDFQQLIIDRANGSEWRRSTTDGGSTWDAWTQIRVPDSQKSDKVQSAWVDLNMINGWTAATDSPIDPTPQYRIDDQGRVYLRGKCRMNAASGAIFANNLPFADYDGATYVCSWWNGTVKQPGIISASDSGGNTTLQFPAFVASAGNYIQLDGIAYHARSFWPQPS